MQRLPTRAGSGPERSLITSRFGRDTTAREVVDGSDLSGRTVIVTGGASGLGLEATRALAAAGADVVIGARDVAAARAVAAPLALESQRLPRRARVLSRHASPPTRRSHSDTRTVCAAGRSAIPTR